MKFLGAFLVCFIFLPAHVRPADTLFDREKVSRLGLVSEDTTGATNRNVLLSLDGQPAGRAMAEFHLPRLRNGDKPYLTLHLASDSKAARELGTTNLILETAELSPLADHTVAKLAHDLGLPSPSAGHVLLTLDQRGLGLYTVTAWPSDGQPLSGFSRCLTSLNGDLGEMAAQSSGAVSNTLARLIRACLEQNLSNRLARISEIVDVAEFSRLMAFQSVIGNSQGYGESGRIDGIALDLNRQRVRFLPAIHQYDLGATLRPVMTRKLGMVAKALLETPEGFGAYVEALRFIGTNTALETTLAREIDLRYRMLLPHCEGREAVRLTRRANQLKEQFGSRFNSVREQLQHHAVEFNSTRLPLLSLGAGLSGGGLPVKSPVDYQERFNALLQSKAALTSSIPISLYTITLSAPTGVLENLSYRSTNWVAVKAMLDGQTFSNATLRLKGHGTRQSFSKKPSFTLKVNDQVLFHGNSKLHVQNSRYDSAYFNYFLASWVFQKARLPAARTEFAEVLVNGVPQGLFVVSEGITKAFLEREFGTAGALLWEGDGVDLNGRLDVDSGDVPHGYARPGALFAEAAQAVEKGTIRDLDAYLDLDKFSKFYAAEVMVGHHDGYSYRRSNYRVTQTTTNAPFIFLPHGADWLNLGHAEVFPENGMVARAFARTEDGRRRYLQSLQETASNTLDMDQLVQDAAALTRKLQPVLKKYGHHPAALQALETGERLRMLGDRQAYLLREIQTHQDFAPRVGMK